MENDTSLFSTVTNAALSYSHLNNYLSKINDWGYTWKISFNPDITKSAHELLSVEKNDVCYPTITFNNVPVKCAQSHKQLGLTLDSKFNFHEHISSILSKVNKLTTVLQKL